MAKDKQREFLVSKRRIISIVGIVLALALVVLLFSNKKPKVFNKLEERPPAADEKRIVQEDRDSILGEEPTFVTKGKAASSTALVDSHSSQQDLRVETLLKQSRDFEYLAQPGNPQALAIAFSQVNSEELRREVRTGLWDTTGDLQTTLASPEHAIIQDKNRVEFLISAAAFCQDERTIPALEELQNTIRLMPATLISEQPVFGDMVELQSRITYAFAKISKNSKEAMKKVFLQFESGDSIARERILDGLAGNTGREAMILIGKGLASSEEGVREAAQRALEINNQITNLR